MLFAPWLLKSPEILDPNLPTEEVDPPWVRAHPASFAQKSRECSAFRFKVFKLEFGGPCLRFEAKPPKQGRPSNLHIIGTQARRAARQTRAPHPNAEPGYSY